MRTLRHQGRHLGTGNSEQDSLRHQLMFVRTGWLHYKCIDTAQPLPPDVNVNTLTFHNHGGQAFICRQSLKLQRKNVNAAVTTFEFLNFLCRFASTASCHFILLMVYCPSSQAMSTIFFSDLSAVFDQLATYQCLVVVCGDFNITGNTTACTTTCTTARCTSDAVAAVLPFHSTRCSANTQGQPYS